MKIQELIRNINAYNDDLIIYIQDIEDIESDILVADDAMGDFMMYHENVAYHYLIEIFLVKEMVNELLTKKELTEIQIAEILYSYAINDA